ncbi:phenol 2-monooxygenase [Aureobasidium sp. EXF-10728]|nr:phenol 2-monooxygenase [Aureobasidium sp. EXF-10728]
MEVDLLIIGAGPAGLMAAAWASQCKLKTRIIDDKDARVRTGQADGLHCRTLEIMDSFGSPSIAHEILGQACVIKEIKSIRSGEEDLPGSRYPQVSLGQGGVEQAFLNFLERDGDEVRVERNLTPIKLHLDETSADDHNAYPVEVHIRKVRNDQRVGSSSSMASEETVPEIFRAKYVLGTDGSHSWTRKALGLQMEGDTTNKHFGVMDFIPLSNFPDIRISCVIHSSSGSIMTLPRENGLVRFYVQLGESSAQGSDFDRSKMTPDDIIKIARKIMHPYTLDYNHCDWVSVYVVGQRLATSFSYHDRIFLAGDAVHTHSPTMGAGMNVSMQDSYNLVWKIATAIRTHNRDILATYTTERMAVAQELIHKDRAMSEFYCSGPSANSSRYQEFRESFRDFVSGVAVEYLPGLLVCSTKDNKDSPWICCKPQLARNIRLGQRLPSYHITNHFTAEVTHIHSAMKSTGHWRIIFFPGDLSIPTRFSAFCTLGYHLAAPNSFIRTLIPASASLSSILEILTIHTSLRTNFDALSLPDIFHPWSDDSGYDHSKVFARSNDRDEDIYSAFGIEEEEGCVVVCRPDQHIGYIGALGDVESLGRYLTRILGVEDTGVEGLVKG